jgi:nucleotide-binding universal stress UspA family protein
VAEIVRAAGACGAELIVLGLGRHPAADRVLGSEAALHVAERAPLPVLAVPAAAARRPRLGVCGVDTDDARFAASAVAARTAAAVLDPAGTLCLARVVAFGNGDAERDGARRRRLAALAEALRADAAVRVETVELRGTPADALLGLAHARGADLLAVGRAADAPLTPLFRGAACAVLVAPPGPEARDGD